MFPDVGGNGTPKAIEHAQNGFRSGILDLYLHFVEIEHGKSALNVKLHSITFRKQPAGWTYIWPLFSRVKLTSSSNDVPAPLKAVPMVSILSNTLF